MTAILTITGVLALSLAIVIVRDVRRRQLLTKRMSIEDKIAEIRERAAHYVHQFQAHLDRKEQLTVEAASNLTALVTYYRQLAKLATSPNVSADEIQRLAEEAQAFVRHQQLKGIFVDVEAEELANLVRRRNGD